MGKIYGILCKTILIYLQQIIVQCKFSFITCQVRLGGEGARPPEDKNSYFLKQTHRKY